jgi:hypothetical protein
MKNLPIALFAVLIFAFSCFSQERSNDEINRQIKQLGVDHITVTYDAASSTSKLMAVAENFSDSEADRAGLQAINFALGFFYPGTSIKTAPETVHFSFWILTKKPRFADSHHLMVDLDGKQLDLGDARYAAKANQNLEYLNFDLTRADLARIGAASKVIFHAGQHNFTASAAQIKLIAAVARISGQ